MIDPAFLSAFPFEHPEPPVSLYDYAPVFRVRDRHGDWVVKRTGLVHSGGSAIGQWLTALRSLGVNVVAPALHFSPNPRRLDDGKEWVVYPFVSGTAYHARDSEIRAAGELLGQMHAADLPETRMLATYDAPVVRSAEWVERHLATAEEPLRLHGMNPATIRAVAVSRTARAAPIAGLPLAGCSFDFKASNLVFGPEPVLVDPDHAARMPRVFDLAVALLLFHCDLPTAPGRLWTAAEWRGFLQGYRLHVAFTDLEVSSWEEVLNLARLDQAIWLLGNWPEGWRDPKEGAYLANLATIDLACFSLVA
ncbi:aminoglycoside phosphotransferase family protein [Methylosinus sp. H3A]|uniref:phosphotransferase enzyme family protein n=1 Tax=Methylosinus sp. H3A TaxID=2785786 RepID=UPI0018C26D73|nr:aminoglycoside phosphotransferase family protein [Methylosinus sp. H3A]MBG0811967.1 aminoglycoside phosphotransferase family protein [Methylosinus sp. H3A]